jgi:hypothetical protein
MQRVFRYLLACAFLLFSAYESGVWLTYRARAERWAGISAMQLVRDDALARAPGALLLAVLFQVLAVVVFPIYLPKPSLEGTARPVGHLTVAQRHPLAFVYSLRVLASVAITILAVISYYLLTTVLGFKLFRLPQ